MQIEKHIKIVPTPTGAVVFFAGQVCLNVAEHSGRYTWSISPVFARLTTGITNCFQVPMAAWDGQPTLAEAIADGLTKLDEMQAFYGVIDIPEDTYVGEHLSEEVDVEDGFQELTESFVVRQVGQSRNHPPRIMISAAAVIGRAREMAKEAGEKSHGKFIKLAHSEIASNMKAESVEELEEGFSDTDTVFLTPQTGSIAHMRYNTFREGSAADHKKAIKYHTKDADRADPKMARFHDMRAKMHSDYLKGVKEEFVQYEDAIVDALASIKEDCRAEALNMSDSLVEAQQLANELFEDIVQEYLNELSKGTLGNYIKKSSVAGAAEVLKAARAVGDGKSEKHYVTAFKRLSGVSKAADKLTKEEVEELDEARLAQPLKGHTYHKKSEAELNYIIKDAGAAARANKGGSAEGKYLDQMNDASTVLYYRKNGGKQIHEELDEAALSGDAYWKAKEAESKEEFLKAQRKALGLPEPVKRGRGKPTLIDRDTLKTRAHSNVEAGKRPTAGFDRNEKIHFVRHLKNHPDFAEKHVSQAGRPVGTTKVAKEQKDLAKKKQDSAFSMWAGLGKR